MSPVYAIGRVRLCGEQIGGLFVTSPAKPLPTMEAGVFDASKSSFPLEVHPATTFHMHAYDACPTVGTRMTIGFGSLPISLRAQLPSFANEDCAP
jgi:hypothetical protein